MEIRNKNLLFVLFNRDFFEKDENKVGGHIAHIIGVINGFRISKFNIKIATFDKVPFLTNISYIFFSKPFIEIPLFTNLLLQFKATKRVIDCIKTKNINLLYIRWASNLFFPLIRKKYPDLKIVLECNSLVQTISSNFLRRFLAKLEDRNYIKHASLIITISQELKEILLAKYGINPDKILINPNGVDTSMFKPQQSENIRKEFNISNSTSLIGFSGNFAPWHKIDLLIEAVQNINHDVKLLLIGTGSKNIMNDLKKLASQKNRDRTIFAGSVSFENMPDYLSTCDILAVPQDKDNSYRSPIKLFEYMAMEKPIIASNVGQIGEIISHLKNGLLFENRVEYIIESIEYIIKNKEVAQELANQAREDAINKHSWEQNVRRVLKTISNE